jgi:hypothetical protein
VLRRRWKTKPIHGMFINIETSLTAAWILELAHLFINTLWDLPSHVEIERVLVCTWSVQRDGSQFLLCKWSKNTSKWVWQQFFSPLFFPLQAPSACRTRRDTCWANHLAWRLAQLCIFTAHVGKTSQQQHNWQNRLHFPSLCSKSHKETVVSH